MPFAFWHLLVLILVFIVQRLISCVKKKKYGKESVADSFVKVLNMAWESYNFRHYMLQYFHFLFLRIPKKQQ